MIININYHLLLLILYLTLGWSDAEMLDIFVKNTFIKFDSILSCSHTITYIFSVGDHDKRKIEHPEVDYRVVKIIIHPSYNDQTIDNDIALLELEKEIQFNSTDYHVYPICLPNADPPVGMNCYITGMVFLYFIIAELIKENRSRNILISWTIFKIRYRNDSINHPHEIGAPSSKRRSLR